MLEFKKDNFKAIFVLVPTLFLMAIFTFWPIINSFLMAFLEEFTFTGNMTHPFSWIAGGTYVRIGFENFKIVLYDPNFQLALKNTFIMVIISVPISVTVGLLIAVALNSVKKLQGFFQTVFFLPYVTNTIALGLVFASVFNKDEGLINTILKVTEPWISSGTTYWRAMFVLMIYTVWNGLAFKIIVFLSGLQSIDKQYYQAAQIDGTSRGRTFRKITVPLLSPMILYITITSFIGAFKAYSSIIAIFGTGAYGPKGDESLLITIVGYIYDKLRGGGMKFGIASAGSLILFSIIMLITLLQFRISKKRVHY